MRANQFISMHENQKYDFKLILKTIRFLPFQNKKQLQNFKFYTTDICPNFNQTIFHSHKLK